MLLCILCNAGQNACIAEDGQQVIAGPGLEEIPNSGRKAKQLQQQDMLSYDSRA